MKRFITFEGGDGTGKSTQIRSLESYLAGLGKAAVITREPGGETSIGKWIRQALLDSRNAPLTPTAELFLYLADRAQHVREVIAPALSQGKIVLCDRHTDSTLAYQGYGRGIDIGLLRRLNDMAIGGIKPDLTLLFDCPVEVGLARTAQRARQPDGKEDRFECEKMDFHNRVRTGFLEIARAEPERFRIIDASRAEKEVEREVRSVIDSEVL